MALIHTMKKNIILLAFTFTLFLISFSSCKKEAPASILNSSEQETTFELSADQAIADNLTEDANGIFMEAAAKNNLLGNGVNGQTIVTTNLLSNAIVTISQTAGFPKTISIDFGSSGSTTANGITHKGKINVVLSDSVRKTGSTSIISFTNYFINNYKKEGTITCTNTSTSSTKAWQRKVSDGKITAPDGRYWLQNGTRDVVQIDGTLTPCNLMDDVYLLTGNQSITNANGKTRNSFITEALQKHSDCDNIGSGKLKVEGANHYAIINFGNGDCDKIATISIDGNEPRIIQLH